MAALIGAHLYLAARVGTTAPPWAKTQGGVVEGTV